MLDSASGIKNTYIQTYRHTYVQLFPSQNKQSKVIPGIQLQAQDLCKIVIY